MKACQPRQPRGSSTRANWTHSDANVDSYQLLIAESTADVHTFSKANELEEKNNITPTQEEIKDLNYSRN